MLTIGIPVLNGKDDLRICLNSIYQNVKNDFKVVVCDDGSTDGTSRMVEQEFPSTLLLRNEKNCGVSYSTNRILRKLKGPYFLRLDADTEVLPGSLEKMVKFMETHPRCGVVAAGLVDANGNYQKNVEDKLQTPLFWFSEYLLWPKKLWLKLYFKMGDNGQTAVRQVKTMGSAAILVRKVAINQTSGLDENLAFFMEDSDWVMRIKKQGWQLWYYPIAKIVHHGGHSAGISDLYIHCRDRSLKSLYYFTGKHFPGRINQTKLMASILTGSAISLMLALALLPLSMFNKQVNTIVKRGLRSFSNVWLWHARNFGLIRLR